MTSIILNIIVEETLNAMSSLMPPY
jgi:hypothetical protein